MAATMLTTLVMAVLAANEVNTVDDSVTSSPPTWSVQLSLATPSVLGASVALESGASPGGLGVLGVIRPSFANALTVEHAFGERWTGVGSLSFGATFMPPLTTMAGAGVLGARWYATRALEGFFVGPEVMFQLNTTDVPGLTGIKTYAAGAGARLGWLQRFGDHFMASASAGLNANVAWLTVPSTMQTLNVGLDLALAAGLLF